MSAMRVLSSARRKCLSLESVNGGHSIVLLHLPIRNTTREFQLNQLGLCVAFPSHPYCVKKALCVLSHGAPLCQSTFFCHNKIPEIIYLKRRKAYLGSVLEVLWSTIHWPHCLGPVLILYAMTGTCVDGGTCLLNSKKTDWYGSLTPVIV